MPARGSEPALQKAALQALQGIMLAPADLAMRSDLLTTAADLATRDDLAPSNAPPDLAPAIVEGRTVYGGCDLAASSRAVSLTSLAWTALALWLARRRLRAQ